ncbi:MAG: HAD family hydrolase [Candidatus Bilamarchaeaceae archaeon]
MAELVIFDMDDTILHLGVSWGTVKKELIKFAVMKGMRVDEKTDVLLVINKMKEKYPKETEALIYKYEKEMAETDDFILFPRMIRLVRELKRKGCKLAICSSNNSKTIRHVLKKAKALDCFDMLVGLDSVRHGKPDPEGLELILRELNVKKKDAVFVGNSELSDGGAGKRAGIRTIVIRTLWEEDMDLLEKEL